MAICPVSQTLRSAILSLPVINIRGESIPLKTKRQSALRLLSQLSSSDSIGDSLLANQLLNNERRSKTGDARITNNYTAQRGSILNEPVISKCALTSKTSQTEVLTAPPQNESLCVGLAGRMQLLVAYWTVRGDYYPNSLSTGRSQCEASPSRKIFC